ncbi:LysR family transcriptional regulator [Comamonas aquatica]|mgnify:CR=1 FL=1|jgi:DNA-binding transcriptional LysR family regulator|uniref:LysR family transcriptional regulator n=2 Tax=Comamonas aquatica TaxID=225991 RepID=UPI002449BEA1|nr:LysR family transcriptional regulator [Comamonas aquatica]MDH0202085.1 LysR family transcriptional regulator [Comamonas aquatica]MDH0371366.1 LysR family transcriptional regulator [Comamonas aquatica]MDH0381402.1 LysR family transcriptional regulator [Comamonas aquatica]MDH0429668.1 LysR family transcriptional regulator [Comamonas aquatica]MDH0941574.1 LysR family transcriptional regulator [Comamonas aquatica]
MRRPIPSTQALACFEASARHESYTRAAQELALTQSAVSRQVIALEEFVGVALFRRTRHGVSLTPAGALYAKKVRGWLQGLERDTLDLMSHQGQGGTVNLAAVPTFATRWLMPRLPLLARQHPDITVHIEVQTRPFLFADTVHDAALYAGTPEQVGNWPGVQVLKLMDEDVVPVCSPTVLGKAAARDLGRAWQPVAPEVLARLPLLQQSTRPYGWQQWFQSVGVDAPRALDGPRYELFSMLAVAASHGLGVALIPPMLVEAELARGELVVACAQPLRGERSYYLVTPNGTPAPALGLFSAWLSEMAAQQT